MINVRLIIAPTFSLSPHDPIWRLHNHLRLLLVKEIMFLVLKRMSYVLCIIYIDRISKVYILAKEILQGTIPVHLIFLFIYKNKYRR